MTAPRSASEPAQGAVPSLLARHRLRGAIAFLLAALAVVALVWRAETARSSGAEIVLETRPIDPRDMFFGYYADLSYAIEAQNRRGRSAAPRWTDDVSGDLPFDARLRVDETVDGALRDALIAEAARREAAWAEADAVEAADEDRSYWRDIERGRPVPLGDVFVALAPDARGFHETILVTADRAAADAAGVAVLQAKAFGSPSFRYGRPNRPWWLLDVRFDLPPSYYADEDTALALQVRAADAGRLLTVREQHEECQAFDADEAARAAALPPQAQPPASAAAETVSEVVAGGAAAEPPAVADAPVAPTEDPMPVPVFERPWFCAELDPAKVAEALSPDAPTFGVVMSVSRQGEAVIKGLRIDGETTYDSLGGTLLRLAPRPASDADPVP